MSEKPEWLLREQASMKSLINELKDKLDPKPCTICGKSFRPVSKFSIFCGLCKARQRRAA